MPQLSSYIPDRSDALIFVNDLGRKERRKKRQKKKKIGTGKNTKGDDDPKEKQNLQTKDAITPSATTTTSHPSFTARAGSGRYPRRSPGESEWIFRSGATASQRCHRVRTADWFGSARSDPDTTTTTSSSASDTGTGSSSTSIASASGASTVSSTAAFNITSTVCSSSTSTVCGPSTSIGTSTTFESTHSNCSSSSSSSGNSNTNRCASPLGCVCGFRISTFHLWPEAGTSSSGGDQRSIFTTGTSHTISTCCNSTAGADYDIRSRLPTYPGCSSSYQPSTTAERAAVFAILVFLFISAFAYVG